MVNWTPLPMLSSVTSTRMESPDRQSSCESVKEPDELVWTWSKLPLTRHSARYGPTPPEAVTEHEPVHSAPKTSKPLQVHEQLSADMVKEQDVLLKLFVLHVWCSQQVVHPPLHSRGTAHTLKV